MNRSRLTESKKADISDKLKRIKGRVEGLDRMVDEDRDPVDIMMQLSATYEAMRVVGKTVLQQFIEESIETGGVMATNPAKKEEAYSKLLDTLYKYIR